MIISNALHLTQGEQDGVYEAVVNLVGLLLRKAKSLKGDRGWYKSLQIQLMFVCWMWYP